MPWEGKNNKNTQYKAAQWTTNINLNNKIYSGL